ncbi:MAG: S41 family peptidase [Thermoanaerobaculia bacterium]
MFSRPASVWTAHALIAAAFALAAPRVFAQETVRPHAGMLRFPDISATHIVFLYADDLWLVPREGGVAEPLASPPGQETRPKFSPDERTIAFIGNYDGNSDLYTVPTEGGVPLRVTYHPATEVLSDWTPDGRLIFFGGPMATYPRVPELFTVAAAGGLPAKMPVPYGAAGAVSPDGAWLAYTPHTRDHRTWKRYRGGMATDIWLFHLTTHEAKKITDWEGTDTQPMWHGSDLVYLSDDGPAHRLNLWRYDAETGEREPLTTFADYDVKWPSIGPGPEGGGEVVFEQAGRLKALDLATYQVRTVDVRVPGARPQLRARPVDVTELVSNVSPSPSAKRVLLEARGDVWTVPAKHGSPRNLTRTSGVAERDPAWSPDGESIAYFSDASGEYELYVRDVDGRGEPRRLTEQADRFLSRPTWSPDSKRIAFWDLSGTLQVFELASGKTVAGDTDPWPSFPPPRVSWSSDSRWIAYTRGGDTQLTSIWLYDAREGEAHQVTSGRFLDTWPTFDRKGDFLYFASLRDFTQPAYEDVGTTFVYTSIDRLYAVPLRREVASPLAPKSDEEGEDEENGEEEEPEKKGGDEKGKEDEEESEEPAKPVRIDLEGFEARAVLLPVPRGSFTDLAVTHEDKLVYTRRPPSGSEAKGAIEIFYAGAEEEDKRVQTVLAEADAFGISADGKKLLARKDKDHALIDPKPEQEWKTTVPIANLIATIDPRAEWRQIFHEAWRLQRDFFYDPGMHGVDWPAVREQYAAMLPDCASRQDVGYVIAEMISELNVGHAYYRGGGDSEDVPEMSVGLPGTDFELADGAYRFARIYRGAPWDADARGPLGEPGLEVEEGDYLLAVNGAPVDATKSPWAAFQGLGDQVVTLTVSDRPSLDASARQVVVKLASNEYSLRLRAWVEANRRRVEEASDGRIGYIYVPNTGIDGQNELFRQFYGQTAKPALIIDERWNGGGQIPTRFVELLDRPPANWWAARDGHDWPWPPDAHFGPKAMLINGLAGSGGDYFPFWFRARGLGPLIGTRTWGGLVGISGNPSLIDGAVMTVPTFAFYEPDGTWGIEGHGVDPDIEVVDDPSQMAGGRDVQLEAAIDYLLAQLETAPFRKPERPPYPDRSGMGIRPEDQ